MVSTAVELILEQLLGSLPASAGKLLLITDAIAYLSSLGYTVTDGGANNSDWAIARVAERIWTKRKLHEASTTDSTQLATLANYSLWTDEIERLIGQDKRKAFDPITYKPISRSDNWTHSRS